MNEKNNFRQVSEHSKLAYKDIPLCMKIQYFRCLILLTDHIEYVLRNYRLLVVVYMQKYISEGQIYPKASKLTYIIQNLWQGKDNLYRHSTGGEYPWRRNICNNISHAAANQNAALILINMHTDLLQPLYKHLPLLTGHTVKQRGAAVPQDGNDTSQVWREACQHAVIEVWGNSDRVRVTVPALGRKEW